MTKKNNTKRALLMSGLALLMCISMLVGSTFAWFTDSVTSGNNIIMSGTLDVVLEYKNAWSDEWAPVDSNTKIFKEGALYEPGYTEIVYLRVTNAGSLALKYMLSFNIANEESSINVYGDEFKLSDYLQVGSYVMDEWNGEANYANILMPLMFGSRESALSNVTLNKLSDADAKICDNTPILADKKAGQVIALVLTMPETVGNEANAKVDVDAPWIELGIRLYAMQFTHENDSYDNLYDENVDRPDVHKIYNAADFSKAFAEGGQAIIENMDLSGENAVYAELAENKSLAINTNNSIIAKQDDKEYAIVNHGNLEITGNGTITTQFKGSIENWGKLYINNLNIDVKGTKYGFHVKAGECEINNLTLTAQRGGINIQGGKVTINSGSVTSTTPDSSYGIGYLVYAGGTAEVIINGVDYRYKGAYYKHGVLYAGNNASIVVNGGTFGKGGSNVSKKPWLQTADKGTITLCGGSYEFDPTQFLSESITLGEGYEVVKGENGWWNVSKIAG
jgi:predicted ribosomally synthesized peptide with SipW-like signal peptide